MITHLIRIGKFPKEIRDEYIRVQRASNNILNLAKRRGHIAPLAGELCVDCPVTDKKPAVGYDHRNYFKPLEVSALCAKHNKLRGVAVLTLKKIIIQMVLTLIIKKRAKIVWQIIPKD